MNEDRIFNFLKMLKNGREESLRVFLANTTPDEIKSLDHLITRFSNILQEYLPTEGVNPNEET